MKYFKQSFENRLSQFTDPFFPKTYPLCEFSLISDVLKLGSCWYTNPNHDAFTLSHLYFHFQLTLMILGYSTALSQIYLGLSSSLFLCTASQQQHLPLSYALFSLVISIALRSLAVSCLLYRHALVIFLTSDSKFEINQKMDRHQAYPENAGKTSSLVS